MVKYLLSLPDVAVDSFYRLEKRAVDSWFCTSDPHGKKVGSGGGTAHLLKEAWRAAGDDHFEHWLGEEKRIIIHAGGESRRLPAYAHTGKILAPIPVFRWGRGQSINQNLLDVQLPLLDEIMGGACKDQNTLIASGDVLIRNAGKLPPMPQADVVCYGLWGSPEKACNHGVFFTSALGGGELAFMLQKPSISQLASHHQQYHYLLDIGIWVLSDRAVALLMKKCGWQGSKNSFADGIPANYDLYSDFGLALGANPSCPDKEISQLSVALVTLEHGEFYHFGKNSELIESTERLQNLIVNQREIWHKKIKPHPSIFIQNCDCAIALDASSRNLWFENASLPASWQIAENHIITGIPVNQWHVSIPAGICLDMVPIDDHHYAIRPYGFNDAFKGATCDESTLWMNQPCRDWFQKRNLSFDSDATNDIQRYPLFPVLTLEQINGGFINWLLSESPEDSSDYGQLYISARRISASQICACANLERLYAQREAYMVQAIPHLAKNYKNSVFYQLDLEKLAGIMSKHGIALPQNDELSGIQLVSDLMMRSRIATQQGLDGEVFRQMAFAALQKSVLAIHGSCSREPKLSVKEDQIVWGRSPLRMDIGGGWSDTPPYCFINGGAVVNVAIEINGQPPIQVFVKPCADYRIVINSIDLGEKEVITSFGDLENFHLVGSPFSIPKAALCLVGFHNRFAVSSFDSLEARLRDFGSGIEISILSAVPKGSGLGTSSILAATVLGTLSDFCSLEWDKIEICNKTLALEQLLTTGGGWQDQLGGVLHGIKLIETAPGFDQLPVVRWLPTDVFEMPQTKGTFLLYYTGITRTAKNILGEIVQGMFLNSAGHIKTLNKIKSHAGEVFEVVMRGNHVQFGEAVGRSWQLNNELDAGTSTPDIERMMKQVADYLVGYKLLGAGGGGFMLMVAKNAEAAAHIREIMEANPVNSKARFVEMSISKTGFVVTRS